MFKYAGRRVLSYPRLKSPSLEIFRRWKSSSFIPEEAFQKVSHKIKQESTSKSSSTSSQSPNEQLAGKIFMGVFLGGSAFGIYSLTHSLGDIEPKFISESSYPYKLWLRARYRVMSFYKGMVDPTSDYLLPDAFGPQSPYYRPYTLVIELDKGLVYSHWDKDKGWTVAKRPYADYFLAYLSQFYEIVVFTNQTNTYGHPIIDKLDTYQGVMYRLYRDSTVYDLETGEQVKDLRLLNRDLRHVILFDPDNRHYATTQPENVCEMKEWNGDASDTFLLDMIPFLESLAISGIEDVRGVLQNFKGKDIPTTYAQNLATVQKLARDEYTRKNSVGNNDLNGQSWLGYFVNGLKYVLGMSGSTSKQLPPSQKEYATMQAQHYLQVMNEMEQHKKLVEEESKSRQEEHEKMMKRLSSIRVTLWDLMTLGPDQAILSKADPEVREYLDKNKQQQQ